MGETAYELLALGLRYWFILLLVLTLVRAFLLMWGDRRAYHRALKRLPDAGLVGEVVNLDTGSSQPLPREGLMGAGRGCDIRLPGLRRREMEFIFRPGFGLRLIPLHRRFDALLDGEALEPKAAYALHGTILELKSVPLRFRLFAGLDVPARQAPVYQESSPLPSDEPDPWDQGFEGEYLPPPGPQPFQDLQNTWQYAPLPPELISPPETPGETAPSRRRRAHRGEGDEG